MADLDWILGRSTAALIGMVHTGPCPAAPGRTSDHTIESLIDAAVTDAQAAIDAGFDAVLVENMHDLPYLRRDVGPETTATMTAVTRAVVAAVDAPVGVQILAGANRAALAVAAISGASFIRAEGFHFASVADEGLFADADAGPLLRYRRTIDAGQVAVVADIKKKHASHALTADVPIEADARAATFCGADGVIVTGTETGAPTDVEAVRRVRAAIDRPVLVGSGVTPENAAALTSAAHGLIVGSWIKHDGDWRRPIDPTRARAVVKAARG